MNFTKATNEQLMNIFLYDKDCPAELFSGLVKEIHDRGIGKPCEILLHENRKLRQMYDKYRYKYYNLRCNKRTKKVTDQLELENARLQVQINTLRRKLRRA